MESASKKAFKSLTTLPIRPFKSRLSIFRSTDPLQILLYSDPIDPIFFTKAEQVTKINKYLLSLVERAKRDALSKGLVGVCLKNYGLKESCFLLLKNDLIKPGQWQNYPDKNLNLGSYDVFFNPQFIETSGVI